MQIQPQNKAKQILEELSLLSKEQAKDQLRMQKYKNEALKIQNKDPFYGFIISGAISSLQRNVEKMHHYHNLAINYEPESQEGYINYATSLIRFGLYHNAIECAGKIYEKDKGNTRALYRLMLATLLAGRINEACHFVRQWNNAYADKPFAASEDVEKAVGIMNKFELADKDTGQTFQILSGLLEKRKICMETAEFRIEGNEGNEWIHYVYNLELKPELFPGLETELNTELSKLSSEIFKAVEIDIAVSDPVPEPENISDLIMANDDLMESIRTAKKEMREGSSLSSDEVFGG